MQRPTVLLIRSDECGWADLRAALDALPDTSVVGEAAHAGQALHLATTHQPDVTIAAARLDGASTAPLLAEIHAAVPTCKLCVMAARLDTGQLVPFEAAGVSVHILWADLSVAALIYQLAAIMASDLFVASPEVARAFIAALQSRTPAAVAIHLTDRERAVLRRLAEGLTHDQIAQTEQMSRRTVERIIGDLEEKLDAPDLFVLGWKAGGLGLLD